VAETSVPDHRRPAASAGDSEPPAPSDPGRDLAGALHEVSNALTVIVGWIERAREPGRSAADLDRALEIAAARAAQARGLVRRAIGAEMPEDPPAAIAAVVADALTGVEPELGRAGIEAVQRVAPELAGRVIAGAPTVVQILTNLLLNAIALSPRGSTVRVEVSLGPSARGGVVFAVVDEGPGIPPERRRTLFESGLSTRAGGAGIGLRHAAALARSLGGSLSLADSPRGARFELGWPLHAPPPPESGLHLLSDTAPTRPVSPASVRRVMPLHGSRILLVEDDDAVVDLLDTALSARGADVVSVRRRAELEDALASGPFDAALVDISPIKDDVTGALATARAASEALKVVLISGSAAQMPSLPDAWVSAWVRKPFEIAEILAALDPNGGKEGG
jgi:CheY-like chemotaxis protein